MRRVVILLDANIIINLFYVKQDFDGIVNLLEKTKKELNLTFITTNVVVNEVGKGEYFRQKTFFKNNLSRIVKVVDISKDSIEQFRINMSLYNFGLGEVSLLYYTFMKQKLMDRLFIILSADKKDVLKKFSEIISILQLKNVICQHGMFLYFLMRHLGFIDDKLLSEILFSSNRDYRISFAYLKEIERESEEKINTIFFRKPNK